MILSGDNISSVKQELSNIQHLNIHDNDRHTPPTTDHNSPDHIRTSPDHTTTSPDHITSRRTSPELSSIKTDNSSITDCELETSVLPNPTLFQPTSFSSVAFPSVSYRDPCPTGGIASMIMQQLAPDTRHMNFDRDTDDRYTDNGNGECTVHR